MNNHLNTNTSTNTTQLIQNLNKSIKNQNQQLIKLLQNYTKHNFQLISTYQIISYQNQKILSQQTSIKKTQTQINHIYQSTN